MFFGAILVLYFAGSMTLWATHPRGQDSSRAQCEQQGILQSLRNFASDVLLESGFQDPRFVRVLLTILGIAPLIYCGTLGPLLYNLGLHWSALVSTAIFGINIIGLLLLWLTDSVATKNFMIFGTSLAIVLSYVTLVGNPGSAGLLSSAYVGPVVLLLIDSTPKRSTLLALFILFSSLAVCILEQVVGPEYLTPERAALPPTFLAVFAWVNANFPSMVMHTVVSSSRVVE